MSRKPADIEAAKAGGRPCGRRAVWAAIRELRSFTKVQLCAKIPQVKRHAVDEYLVALIRGEYIASGDMVTGPSMGCGRVRQYHLIRDVGVRAPRLRKDGTQLPPTEQQQMWIAMKVLGWFTVAELAGSASTERVPVHLESARSYVRHLHLAGYLQNRDGGSYRLSKDTGGLAPMVQRTKVVFDPNTNSVAWYDAKGLEP